MPFVNDMMQSFAKQQKSNEVSDAPITEQPASAKIVTRFTYNVEKAIQLLQNRIVGQPEALEKSEHILRLVRADISDPTRPLYISLFLGPTGVGKTEIVRLLAEAIHGNRDAFCRVDMNTLSQEHYAASLTGSPPGYVGSKEGITILEKEKIEGSYSAPGIVLFDEIEKASTTVLQTLLNVFDNGIMTVASGQQTINFRNSIIFMTSNLGAREIQEYAASSSQYGFPDRQKTQEIINKELEKSLSPEFINRIDDIVMFNWISKNTMQDIILLELKQLNQRLQKHHCELQLDDSLLNFLTNTGFDERYGARAIKRVLRAYVEVPLANYLLSGQWNPKNSQSTTLLASRQGSNTIFNCSG